MSDEGVNILIVAIIGVIIWWYIEIKRSFHEDYWKRDRYKVDEFLEGIENLDEAEEIPLEKEVEDLSLLYFRNEAKAIFYTKFVRNIWKKEYADVWSFAISPIHIDKQLLFVMPLTDHPWYNNSDGIRSSHSLFVLLDTVLKKICLVEWKDHGPISDEDGEPFEYAEYPLSELKEVVYKNKRIKFYKTDGTVLVQCENYSGSEEAIREKCGLINSHLPGKPCLLEETASVAAEVKETC